MNENKTEVKHLKEINEEKLAYETGLGTYYVLGGLSSDLGTLKTTIHFEEQESKRKQRSKFDLYERQQVLNFCKLISETEHIDSSLVEGDLLKLTDLLEKHREEQFISQQIGSKALNKMPPEAEKKAIEFLKSDNLIRRIDQLIETSGVVGEENNRKMLFVIASTYKMPSPLHGLIQGTSGSGKTHLINAVSDLMPTEDVLSMTRVTSKSFYHYRKEELVNKLLVLQDIDGLDEEALFAFREMQTAGYITSSTTYKNKAGQLVAALKRVDTKFASMVATTHAEIYFDNLSRSIVLGVDESEDQTKLIIQNQNKKTAGLIDEKTSMEAKELLQNCVRVLKPYEVVNRYADKLLLPVEAKMLRRLNSHYQAFVTQITLLHQYQRKKDEQGRLIATKEDLKLACDIMFDAIMWKIDELDSSLRQFFERYSYP
jgi:ABC-type molybdenum transport system ATPase subunit/photorepair protein PhrA